MNSFPDAKILYVDLTNNVTETVSIDGEEYRKYLGGSTLALYLILKEMDPTIDPYDEKSLLVFAVSPLVGIPFYGNSRVVVCAKSPLTGTIGDSQGGGYFPAHLKANGYDAVVFKGKSSKPVYLYIDEDEITLKDASHLWGKSLPTADVEDMIINELGDKQHEIIQIGAAGENLVKYACILSRATRANGRGGMGAVMGSKMLKAIVVKRKSPRKAFNKEAFLNFSKHSAETLKTHETMQSLYQYGTAGDTESFNDIGFLVTNNWQSGYMGETVTNISGETMEEEVLTERDTCFGCGVRCKRVVKIEERGVEERYGGPEYETVASFGSTCGVDNLEDICVANQLCNMYGLDTISAGATIAFAMECYEKGLLPDDLVEDFKLNFGNGAVYEKLLVEIATRSTPLGDMLAEGSYRAAEKLGSEAKEMFMGVKKQEFPYHMPQFKPAVGIVYATNPFGADHQSSEHDQVLTMPEDSIERKRLSKLGINYSSESQFEIGKDKAHFAYTTQKYFSLLDTLCLCQFVWGPSWEMYGPDELLELLKICIGYETTIEELMLVGERRINMMKYFNEKNGFNKKDDKLPKRIFEVLTSGESKGVSLNEAEFENAVDHYYEVAGWDTQTGNPKLDTYKKLSLEWILKK